MVETGEIFYTGSMFDTLNQAAQAGGEVLLDKFGKVLTISTKSNPNDLLTDADTGSQIAIVQNLISSMIDKGFTEEEIGFIGEEDSLAKIAKHTFVIDPLDGTSSFAAGRDTFAVSIAYMRNGLIEAGLVYDPMPDITYFAELGKGAYRIKGGNRERVTLAPVSLEDVTVAINSTVKKDLATQLYQTAVNLTPHVRQIKGEHASVLVLMSLMENRYQVGMVAAPSLWDIAATKLIIEEAGGEVWDWTGKPLVLDPQDLGKCYPLMAGHPKSLKEVLKYVE